MPKAVITLGLSELETIFGLNGDKRGTVDLGDTALVEVREGVLSTFFEKYFHKYLQTHAAKEVEVRAKQIIKSYVDEHIGYYKQGNWNTPGKMVYNKEIQETIKKAVDEYVSTILSSAVEEATAGLKQTVMNNLERKITSIEKNIDTSVSIRVNSELDRVVRERVLEAITSALGKVK